MMPVQNAAKLLVQSSNALRAFKVRKGAPSNSPQGGESEQLEKNLWKIRGNLFLLLKKIYEICVNLWATPARQSRAVKGSKFKVQGARANGTIVLQLLELLETP